MDSVVCDARLVDDWYSWSVVPFRCVAAVRTPPTPAVVLESLEFEATCPDGWYRSPVAYAAI